jgi:hypothetical protein
MLLMGSLLISCVRKFPSSRFPLKALWMNPDSLCTLAVFTDGNLCDVI